MPQIRGSANWLTNLRQEARVQSIGIDQSEQHILNNVAEEEMRAQIDQLHIQQHRVLVDTEFELQETRKEVENYGRMQEMAKLTNVDVIMRKRPSKCSTPVPSEEKLPISSSNFLLITTGVGDEAQSTGKRESSVTKVDSEDEDQGFHQSQSHLLNAAEPARVKRITSSRSRTRRPRTSYLPGRRTQEIRRAVRSEFTEAPKKTRPKTSLGIRGPEEDDSSENEEQVAAGRSFQELKKVSHIDKLLDAEKNAKREEQQRILQQQRQKESAILQQRIEQFYKRLDDFKKSSNKKSIHNIFNL